MKKNASILLVFAVITWLLPLQGKETNKKELDGLNREIEVIEKRIVSVTEEKTSILNEIYKVELQQKKAKVENNKLKLQLRTTKAEIGKKKVEKVSLEKKIAASRANIGKALRILYKMGEAAYIKFFVSVESFDSLFKNYRLFSVLLQYKAVEINQLKKSYLHLNRINKELENEHSRLTSLQKEQEEKIVRIEKLKRDKLEYLERVNSDRNSYLRLLDELQREAARLDKVFGSQFIKKRIKSLDVKKLRGKLRWPLKGKVISSFGKKRSTKFDTYILNNGVEIKPSGTDEIQAIYDGEVVFNEYFKGYGNLIIIQHAKNFFSLYGHCEKILKEKGDIVYEGETISIAGNTGSTAGKSLYLEIRRDLKPEDPLKWLCGK